MQSSAHFMTAVMQVLAETQAKKAGTLLMYHQLFFPGAVESIARFFGGTETQAPQNLLAQLQPAKKVTAIVMLLPFQAMENRLRLNRMPPIKFLTTKMA